MRKFFSGIGSLVKEARGNAVWDFLWWIGGSLVISAVHQVVAYISGWPRHWWLDIGVVLAAGAWFFWLHKKARIVTHPIEREPAIASDAIQADDNAHQWRMGRFRELNEKADKAIAEGKSKIAALRERIQNPMTLESLIEEGGLIEDRFSSTMRGPRDAAKAWLEKIRNLGIIPQTDREKQIEVADIEEGCEDLRSLVSRRLDALKAIASRSVDSSPKSMRPVEVKRALEALVESGGELWKRWLKISPKEAPGWIRETQQWCENAEQIVRQNCNIKENAIFDEYRPGPIMLDAFTEKSRADYDAQQPHAIRLYNRIDAIRTIAEQMRD